MAAIQQRNLVYTVPRVRSPGADLLRGDNSRRFEEIVDRCVAVQQAAAVATKVGLDCAEIRAAASQTNGYAQHEKLSSIGLNSGE